MERISHDFRQDFVVILAIEFRQGRTRTHSWSPDLRLPAGRAGGGLPRGGCARHGHRWPGRLRLHGRARPWAGWSSKGAFSGRTARPGCWASGEDSSAGRLGCAPARRIAAARRPPAGGLRARTGRRHQGGHVLVGHGQDLHSVGNIAVGENDGIRAKRLADLRQASREELAINFLTFMLALQLGW
jgi:hypothetical protein